MADGHIDWICDEEAIQFELPDLMTSTAEHKVEYSLGESQTYRYEIPFGGGQGFIVYTLQGN